MRVDDGVEIAERRSARAHAASARRASRARRPARRRRRRGRCRRPWPAVDARQAGADDGDAFPSPLRGRCRGMGERAELRRVDPSPVPDPSPQGGGVPRRATSSTASTIFTVAGAAAEHAAERVLDLPRGRRAASASGNRPPPSACRACRCRIAPRRARGTLRAAGRSARPGPCPSTVSIAAPSACAVATRQAQTCSPSISTVQAPQSPASQPILVPVRPSSSRKRRGEVANGCAVDA